MSYYFLVFDKNYREYPSALAIQAVPANETETRRTKLIAAPMDRDSGSFHFGLVDSTTNPGYYTVTSREDPTLVFDVYSRATADGSQVGLYALNGQENQLFNVSQGYLGVGLGSQKYVEFNADKTLVLVTDRSVAVKLRAAPAKVTRTFTNATNAEITIKREVWRNNFVIVGTIPPNSAISVDTYDGAFHTFYSSLPLLPGGSYVDTLIRETCAVTFKNDTGTNIDLKNSLASASWAQPLPSGGWASYSTVGIGSVWTAVAKDGRPTQPTATITGPATISFTS